MIFIWLFELVFSLLGWILSMFPMIQVPAFSITVNAITAVQKLNYLFPIYEAMSLAIIGLSFEVVLLTITIAQYLAKQARLGK